ncbi:MAG: hypothetical protein ACRC17_01885 [Culicoidibacterales bacterium]
MFYQKRSEKEIKAEKRRNMLNGALEGGKMYAETSSQFLNSGDETVPNNGNWKLGLAIAAIGALVGAVESSKKEVKTRTGFWK